MRAVGSCVFRFAAVRDGAVLRRPVPGDGGHRTGDPGRKPVCRAAGTERGGKTQEPPKIRCKLICTNFRNE